MILARPAGTPLFIEAVLWIARAGSLDATCFLPLATGIVFKRATPVGAKKGVGNLCWNRSPMILIWNNFSSIAQSFEFISMAQVQKKKGFRASVGRLVEGFFNKIKQFRCMTRRYEKPDPNFMSMLNLVCTIICLA